MPTPEGLAAHRFGFGPRAGQLPRLPIAGGLAQGDEALKRFPAPDTAAMLEFAVAFRDHIRAHEPGSKAARNARKAAQKDANARAFHNARIELARAVGGQDSYRERLVRFWADHFTVTARRQVDRPMITAFADDVVRKHLTGRFADLLRAAILHPAMLGYLDQTASVGPESAFGQKRNAGLNENLARELLELHTLGVDGGYSQTDVRQTALLLTGLAVNGRKGTVFDPRRAEPGTETVLGRRYGDGKTARLEDVLALLDDLAAHPTTAQHICWKLAVHFVSDTPDPALIADLVAVWRRSDGDLLAVSSALASHPAANRPVLEKARQPFDFIVAGLRALGLSGEDVMAWNDKTLRRHALTPMATMGQRWQTPNGPDGWEEGFGTWITPQALATRIDWAMTVPQRLVRPLPDARAFVDHALAGMADDGLRTLVARSESNAEGVGLVLASPLFNRR